MKKKARNQKKSIFEKDGYQSGGSDSRNSRPASYEERVAVGKAHGRGPVPTILRKRL